MAEAFGVIEHGDDRWRHLEYPDVIRGWHRHRQVIGPAPDHDHCDVEAGWLAAGNHGGLCERRPHALLQTFACA